jgi:CRISPR-associated endonuclease/helicase Cas3
MLNDFYAHSLLNRPQSDWQRLEDHLNYTAELAAEFASAFGAAEWAFIAGKWHDLGKYSKEFQKYLRSQNGIDAHIEDAPGRVDHSTAGAHHAIEQIKMLGHLLAYCLAGHHSGLLDARAIGSSQEDRLKKKIPSFLDAPDSILKHNDLAIPAFLKQALASRNAFSISFFVRMVFSCLVDADFLDTERFMQPDKSELRTDLPKGVFRLMGKALDEFLQSFILSDAPVNGDRAEVRAACLQNAENPPGFFSLTVPTGGGKTLSSLAFALRHALTNDMQRIVYVVPFTTIIEQNADEFRKVMNRIQGISPDRLVIEHHSNFDPEKETPFSRLACENWNAPLIVTTSVQFYESLFANRTSHCRKLHNLARAVIILDEAQILPVDFLKPCLHVLKELAENYGSTVLLCTATQPAIHKRPDFLAGIENVREIIPNPPALYQRLKRVHVRDLGTQTDADISTHLKTEEQVLCVVNTRKHASILMKTLGKAEGHFHLSALMCPEHRSQKLQAIRERLVEGKTCRVVSTQLIEAGVDVDFPLVFRSMAGLDSIAQAAGRCNRNGRMPDLGRVFIFRSEHQAAERFVSETSNAAAQVLALYGDDPLSLESIERYFRLYYWDQTQRWDEHGILDRFKLDGSNPTFPFLFHFAAAAKDFRLILENTRPVVIPWNDKGEELCDTLRKLPCLNREIARRLQRYTVQIRSRAWYEQSNKTIEPVLDGSLAILISPQLNYSDDYGLHFDVSNPDSLIA